MCKLYQTDYIGCRKANKKASECIKEEELIHCAQGPCSTPKVEVKWQYFKCPQHGGPSPEQRMKKIAEEKKAGTHVTVVERKGAKPNEWHGATCTLL